MKNNNKAYTLFELVFVLAVAGIILGALAWITTVLVIGGHFVHKFW